MAGPQDTAALRSIQDGLASHFVIGWYLLLPLVLVLGLVVRRVPALPALLLGGWRGASSRSCFSRRQWVAAIGFANLTIERVGPETIEGLDAFQAAGSPAAAKQ